MASCTQFSICGWDSGRATPCVGRFSFWLVTADVGGGGGGGGGDTCV